MTREHLPSAFRGAGLSRDEARDLVGAMVRGEFTDEEIAGLLRAIAERGETGEEILGGAEALRAEAIPFSSGREVILDTCGTGGDQANTFNISTAAALVAAAAGVPVAKHGNRSVSSRCGSADVLEALGARIDFGPDGAARALEETGFTFLNARVFHPAMRRVAKARSALGIRTLFNWLGPLSNPAPATHQLLGVSDRSKVPVIAEVLRRLGVRRALVVHGTGGLDELALAEGNTALESGSDGVGVPWSIDAGPLGLAEAPNEALRGGDPTENANIIRAIFAGERGPRRDALVLNASAALWIAGAANALQDAVSLAAEQLDSGRAKSTLERFVTLSQQLPRDL